jgi:hypothetical protein
MKRVGSYEKEEIAMEKKLAHLEMIQGVANRLSHNSFLLKGWCVVLVSGLFALSAGDRKTYFIYCFEDGVLGCRRGS